MKARIQGEVFRSVQEHGKKFFTTSITQSDSQVIPEKVSTVKQYKTGDKIDVVCRVSSSLFNGKSYLVIQEVDELAEKISQAEYEQASKGSVNKSKV